MMNDRNKDKERVITLAEAAEIYGFNHGYLRRLIHEGRLEARKSSHVWLTTPADVEAYIRSREKRGKYREDIQA
jgi:excisionase family DNA binding protein